MSEITDEYTVDLSWIPKGFYDVLMTSYQIMELPTEIKIVAPPSKLIYTDGEDIDLTGMLVVAFKKDGTIWSEDPNYPNGIIPLSEITIEPTVADAGQVSPDIDVTADLDIPYFPQTFKMRVGNQSGTSKSVWHISDKNVKITSFSFGVSEEQEGYYAFAIMASEEFFTFTLKNSQTVRNAKSYTQSNKTVYFASQSSSSDGRNIGVDDIFPWYAENSLSNKIDLAPYQYSIAWAMIYSDGIIYDNQSIEVKWSRIDDEKELTETFRITVN